MDPSRIILITLLQALSCGVEGQETGLCSLMSGLCVNGGTCIQQGTDSENSNVACLCTPRFTGLRCEVAPPTTLPTTMRMATSTGTLPSTVEDMMTDPSRDNITDGVTARETSPEMAQTSTSMETGLCSLISELCFNGGTCIQQGTDSENSNVACLCTPRFTGLRCEVASPTTLPTTMRMATSTGTLPSTVEDMMTDPSRDNITDGVTARETSTEMAQTSTSMGTRPSTVEDMITDASTDVITDEVTARETASVTAQTFISSGTAPSTIEDMMIDPATDVITDLVTARETSFVTAQSPTPSGTGTFTAEDATTRAVTNMTTNRSVIQDTSAVIAETSSLSGTLIFTERRRTDVSIALISSVANLRAERCIFCQEIDDNGECIDDDGFTTCDILEDEICISVNVTFTIKGSKNRQVSRGCIAKVFFGVTSSRCISVEEYTTALGFDPVEEPSSGEACFCDEEDLCNTHSLSETIILRLAPSVPGGSVTIEWFIIGEGLDFEGFYVEVQTEESEQWVRLSSFLGADVRNFTVESLENVTGIRIVAIDQSKSEVARSIQVPIRSVESGTYENMDRNVSELILVPAASLLVFVAFAAIVLKLRKANLLKETPR